VFHGNPHTSELNLAMAGSQWVVFDKVMAAFNERRVANGESDVVSDGGVNKSRTHRWPAGTPGGDDIADATPDLLDPAIRVSQVDHINAGIHRGINAMYQRMSAHG
jgi:hypothetical protein